MQIEEIKNIWKQQKAKDIEVQASEHYSSLLDELKKNEAKVKRNYILMTVIMILTIVFIDKTAVEKMTNKTVVTWTGFGMIYLAILGILVVSWATVIKFKVNGVTESSLEFLKSAREKLAMRNKIRTTGVPIYIFFLTAGITLTYIQITEPMDFILKVITFFLFYLFMFIVTFITIRKERKKYMEKVKPIEDKIDDLISNI
jgi:hypothetical protein